MTETFPSAGWFCALADRMAAQPEKYRKLGAVALTLERVESVRGPHPVVLEGEYAAWREMIENIRWHGRADLQHTLNYLTLPDWPLRLVAVDDAEGQLDVDRFYRYNETLQEFFDEASRIETHFVADGG